MVSAGTEIGPVRVPIRVLLSDQSKMGCELLASALERQNGDFDLVSSVTDSERLVSEIALHKPDVALISISLADGRTAGMSVLRELRAKNNQTLAIILLDEPSPELIAESFRLGARGIFYRNATVEQLCKCIRVVSEGQIWASNADWQAVYNAFRDAVPVRPVDAHGESLLTQRQKELVSLVLEGLTNREIAQRLGISEHTVKNYLFRIFDKLGVSSRAELIIYSMRNSSKQ